MSATASGADNRQHSQGNQDRKYTPEQKAAVLRIRKCSGTQYYEILSLERTATDTEIKKAYRKQSLLTHPDKNGYEEADEAFKCGFISFLHCKVSFFECMLIWMLGSGVACFPGSVRFGQEVPLR